MVGVRQSATGPPRNPRDLVHRVGNALLNFVAGELSGSRVLDVCSGFWGVQVERAQELNLISYDFGIEAELFLKGHRAGWTILQIPIPYGERVGEAKLHAVSDGIRILLSIIRFGHKSLQAAPPPTSLVPVFIRDLLVTALIGGGDLVLVTPPSRENEARAVAFLLERSDLRPEVLVRPETTPSVGFPGASFSGAAASGREEDPTFSLDDLPPSRNGHVGPVIRFGQGRRALYVDMPELKRAGDLSGSELLRTTLTDRSGAYLLQPRTAGDFLDPIRQLAGRLNSDDQDIRTNFLEANGLSVQRAKKESPEPTPSSEPKFDWGRVRS